MGDNTCQPLGIASSIEYSAEMQTSFLAGLQMNPIPNFVVRDKAGYRLASLRKAISDLITAQVDLIVTFGGLVACNAAKAVVVAPTTIKFISLIGGQPPGFVPHPPGCSPDVAICKVLLKMQPASPGFQMLKMQATFPAGPRFRRQVSDCFTTQTG
jgi:hypothetical protein